MADIIPFDRRGGGLWFDGKLVAWEDAKIHVLNHGLHYASSVFEGERLYNGRIYKLEEHTARLFESARILGMTIPYTEDEINKATLEAVGGAELHRRLYPPRRLSWLRIRCRSPPNSKIHVAIAVWDSGRPISIPRRR